MKILIVDDETEIREVVGLELEARLSCELQEAADGQEAIDYLERHNDIDLIVSDYDMPHVTGGGLYQYVRESGRKIPFVLLSAIDLDTRQEFKSFYRDKVQNAFVQKPCVIDELLETISELMGKNDEQENAFPYCRVGLLRFFRFNNVSCDVYLRLSERKYVRLIKHDDLYDSNLLEKYDRKSVKYLYIRKEDYSRFVQYYSCQIKAAFGAINESTTRKLDIQLASVSFVYELVENLGIDPLVLELAQQTINSSLGLIVKEAILWELLVNMIKKQNFLYEHSLMTAYISCAIAIQMGWGSDAMLNKLALASMLHDIGLEEMEEKFDDHHIRAIESAEFELFSWRDQKKLKTHSLAGASRVRDAQNMPPDVDRLIEFHHETPDGSGHPKGVNAYVITPICCLFIIAEHFARRIYCDGVSPTMLEKIREEFMARYDVGNFKRPLQGLVKLLKK